MSDKIVPLVLTHRRHVMSLSQQLLLPSTEPGVFRGDLSRRWVERGGTSFPAKAIIIVASLRPVAISLETDKLSARKKKMVMITTSHGLSAFCRGASYVYRGALAMYAGSAMRLFQLEERCVQFGL
jgi:hypothetical protein